MIGPTPWLPYCGIAPQPAELIARWNLDPLLLVIIAATSALLWRAAPADRRPAVAGAAALALLLFVSPLCALTSALFAARSAHHVLMITLLAPLLAAALPPRRAGGRPGGLLAWTALSALTLWIWHAPPLYGAALASDAVYWAMQLSLLGTAAGFWLALGRAGPGPSILALLASMVQMGLLGALLTFSTSAFYDPHFLTTSAWGLSPLEDQQLGGLIMWVPGASAYLFAALFRLHRLVGPEPRGARA